MIKDREIYKLVEPVTFGNREVTEIALQTRVRGKHLKAAGISLNESTWADQLKLIAVLSGQTDLLIEELAFEDLQALVVVVGSFLFPSRQTGGSGSQSLPETSDSPPANS